MRGLRQRWLVRPSPSGWPSSELVQEIFETNCHLDSVGRGKRLEDLVDFYSYCNKPEEAVVCSLVVPTEGNEERGSWIKPNGVPPFPWLKINSEKVCYPCNGM